ncbi:uracil-DNA glycosylase [Teredinibacter purpureus]|uniref:uracil-DNA glycosylase n=1 Tax=Teredinibacter purpureus TaxID=2731756 RepID=UPI0005F78F40|nr:uracil-DNA glycosylase [Teredinibacter purpureus]
MSNKRWAGLKLHSSWRDVIGDEFDKPYMRQLNQFLEKETQAGKTLFPPADLIFNALNATRFSDIKVVILGQDPYHGPGQAHGLCFSVLPSVRIPPSLRNIFKELAQDIDLPMPTEGCLQAWAEQGVLLLNATLTVEGGQAGSHQRKGWETFTDAVINAVNIHKKNVVFLLWGSYAHKKGQYIDSARHYILTSPHPSPLSAHRGFFGNNHFSKTNVYLASLGLSPIDWSA